MAYTTILLDLDGTLTDSKEGIINCLRYAFDSMGVPCPEQTILHRFIGPPMPDSLQRYCNMNDEQIQEAMSLFQGRYQEIGKFENTPAPGMLALCQRLHQEGYQLGLASSKPEIMCRDICDKFGFTPYLQVIAGESMAEHGTKADVIRDALGRLGIPPEQSHRVLMVGDRKYDVLGAKACNIPCVGVEFFGYAPEGELQEAGALAVFQTAQDLQDWILHPSKTAG